MSFSNRGRDSTGLLQADVSSGGSRLVLHSKDERATRIILGQQQQLTATNGHALSRKWHLPVRALGFQAVNQMKRRKVDPVDCAATIRKQTGSHNVAAVKFHILIG